MKFFNRKSIKEINEERKNQLTNDMLVFVDKNFPDCPKLKYIIEIIVKSNGCSLDYKYKYGIECEQADVKIEFSTISSKKGEIAPEDRGRLTIKAKNIAYSDDSGNKFTNIKIEFSKFNDNCAVGLGGNYYDTQAMGSSSVFSKDDKTLVQHMTQVYGKQFDNMLDVIDCESRKHENIM